ncbi:MAG: SDR family NAD(P)-dependent oxidoreductase [Gammaproteobacteria bacterium]|nr:SDR family NAD(P)-dependent oxidoreductase [Gammaproteobacteria bacterium]
MKPVPDTYRDSVVVITGATGFIGAHLAARLCDLGAQVHGMARSNPALAQRNYHAHTLDLGDYAAVKTAIKAIAPHYVFHLASYVMGAPDLQHMIPAFQANLASSVHVLTACAETVSGQKRVVLTGSLVEPPAGELETIPSSPYAAAKWASSSYARMFHALYGLPTNIARVFMVYGPAQRDESKLVPYVMRSLLAGQAPKITSGQRLIDWIYVSDVVEGFLAIAATPGIEGQSVDLGSGQVIATRDLVLKIAALLGGAVQPEFGALPDRPLEPLRTADIARSYQQTGWRPQVTLEQGLRAVIAYYRGVSK